MCCFFFLRSKLADGLLSGRYSRSAVDDVVGPDGVEIASLSEEEKQKLIDRVSVFVAFLL